MEVAVLKELPFSHLSSSRQMKLDLNYIRKGVILGEEIFRCKSSKRMKSKPLTEKDLHHLEDQAFEHSSRISLSEVAALIMTQFIHIYHKILFP